MRNILVIHATALTSLKILNKIYIIQIIQTRSYKWRGDTVTNNEIELLELIRENDNPELALMTAAVILIGLLKQHESSQQQPAVCLQATF